MPTMRRSSLGNLPVQANSFVGRRREVGQVKRLLTGSRLTTLTGGGGVGKTRLALRVAGDVRRAFPDGVWFVDLTALRASRLLTREIRDLDVLVDLVRAALGLREQGTGASARQLTDQLAG